MLDAVTWIVAEPGAAVGATPSVAVPSRWSTNVSPAGSPSLSVNDGEGKPLAWIVNDPPVPALNEAAAAVSIVGTCVTVRTKAWTASEPTPLCAVIESG